MTPPILVYEPCTLDIFDTVEAAKLYHEEWILNHESNAFYDSEGRRLNVGPGTEQPIKITCDPNAPVRPEELADAITKFLLAIGKSRDEVEGLALPALIEMAYPFAHNTN